jgi:DNA repair exonuclease SbcCD ATPase subunit
VRRLAAALTLVGVLAAAGCGSSDVDTLQEEVDRLEGQVALQQQQLDKLESETEAIRTLESRLGDIEGLLQGLADRVPELGQLQELLDQLRGLLP